MELIVLWIWHIRKAMLLIFISGIVFSCEKDFGYEQQLLDEDENLNYESSYIVVLGDIQEYTSHVSNLPYYQNSMNWIWSQKHYGKDIKCILHVGDITGNNIISQWKIFYDYTAPVAEDVLYVTCVGNHDYDWYDNKIYDRASTHINEYAKFSLTDAYILEYFEYGKIENAVVANTINGERYDIIVLEFGPRDEVIEWANDYIKAHSDRKYILMTHEFLANSGERISSNSYAERQFVGTTWNSPENVWQKLIKDNDNIVCVLCGHNGFVARQFSENSAGRAVPQILFNLQYQNNGGDGWIQLWEFPYGEDCVNVSVYNTIRREYHPDPSLSFKFRYKY